MKKHSDYKLEIDHLKKQAVERLFYISDTEKIRKVQITKDKQQVKINTGNSIDEIAYIIVKQSKMIAVTRNKTVVEISRVNVYHYCTSLENCILPVMQILENHTEYKTFKKQ